MNRKDKSDGEPDRFDRVTNLMAEQIILGSILLDNQVISKCRGRITPNSFFFAKHRMIFQVLTELTEINKPLNYVSVEDALRNQDELETVGADYIEALTDKVPCGVVCNLDYYIDVVAAKETSRVFASVLATGKDTILQGGAPDEVARVVIDQMTVVGQRHDKPRGLVPLLERIEKYQTGEIDPTIDLDMETFSSVYPTLGELVIVAARPSIGKTALAVYLVEKLLHQKQTVLFLSIEMDEETIQMRRLAAVTRVPISRIRQRGGLSGGEWTSLSAGFERLQHEPIEILDGGFSLGEIIAEIRRDYAERKTRAVFIDHLGLINLPRGERRDLELGHATRTLARLAKDLNLVIFLLCQLNRQLENREDRRPRLSDLRDSGRIEEDADAIWLLHREMVAKTSDTTFEVGVAKNRNGPCKLIEMDFLKESGCFKERFGTPSEKGECVL